MPWRLEAIEQDWLRGARIAYSPQVITEAFNRVERTLGRAWMEGSRTHAGGMSWGAAPTLHIVRMGQMLAALEGSEGAEDLIARVHEGDESAHAELTAVYLLRSGHPSVTLELGPEVVLDQGTSKPDIRLRDTPEGPWVYVEVTQPEMSEAQEQVQALMNQVAGLVQGIKKSFGLDVFLRREPTEPELEAIVKRIPEFCLLEGASVEELPDGLGFLFLNRTKPGQIVIEDPPGEENRPRLGRAMAVAGADEPHRHISVRIAFSDERAERFLRTEARQLPTEAPGLVMVQMSRAPGGFRSWGPLLRRRFQPDIHTRVSAVCLFEGAIVPTADGEKWLPQTKVLLNPHAAVELPQWLIDGLTQVGAEFEKLLPRKEERGK